MIKKFERFAQDLEDLDIETPLDDDPAVVLNLKEKDGKIINFHPIYAIASTVYKSGNPPLISSINRADRTPEQKEFLKLAEYFHNEFNAIIREKGKEIFREIDPYGEEDWGDSISREDFTDTTIVDFIENKGYYIRRTKFENMIEIIVFFRSKEEIDAFLSDVKEL